MRKENLNIEPRKFVFMTEIEFIKHFGENYEDAVNEYLIHDKPVLRIHNINGCTSSIPIERAKYLLEKYYKMTNKSEEKRSSEPKKQKSEVSSPEESKELRHRNSSQSPEYV